MSKAKHKHSKNRVCPNCNSERLKSKGLRTNSNGEFRQFRCKDCGKGFQLLLKEIDVSNEETKIKKIEPYLEFRKEFPEAKGIVVTSAVNDTGVNRPFIQALEAYCDSKGFQLLVIPLKYLNPSALNKKDDCTWPKEVSPYLFRRTYTVDGVLKIIGDCNIQATATHPLTGIDGLTDGMTTIVGHPIVQMKTLPVNEWRDPIILHSTGSVSLKNNYSASKAGYRASYHHCFAGVVIEFDGDKKFHIRQLMADKDGGFYDLGDYWGSAGYVRTDRADALVLGDEHLIFADPNVQKATFLDGDSIVQTLKPKYLIRHDVLDCFSVSSHHANNFILRYAKHQMPLDKHSIEAELKVTVDQLVETTPPWSKSLLVDSNHNSHLSRWLNIENGIKFDYVNAKFYHQLMYHVLSNIDDGIEKDAFQIYVEEIYRADREKVDFIEDGFEMHGIVLSLHGDKGPNGSRGSIGNLSKIGERAVVGHSHCFVDGHSALTKSGWKPIYDVAVGELVLAYDSDTKQNKWVENEKTHVMQYTGSIVKFGSHLFKQEVTPNHMLFTLDGEYVNVCEAILTKMPSTIPIAAMNGCGDDCSDYDIADDDIRRIVAFAADGSIEVKGNNNYMSFHLKKVRKMERLKMLFGESFTPKSGVIRETGDSKFFISTGSRDYAFLDSVFGDKKRLPEFFRDMSLRQKEIAVEELRFWDGAFDTGGTGRQWSSNKKEEADLVSSMCVELGYRTTSFIKENRPSRRYTLFVVTWNVDRNVVSSSNKEYAKNRERVWGASTYEVENVRVSCLTTKVRNFWVKHDKSGQVSLTGNSPGIQAGLWQVGTSSLLRLEYNKGPSSWLQTHCVIYPNGKRQLVNIVSGKWRSK